MDNPVARIVAKFGSQSALAKATGRSQPAVADWVRKGFIPAALQVRVLEAARERGIELGPADFFPTSAVADRAA